MAEIEIGPLTDRLSDEEIAELAAQLERQGAAQLPKSDDKEGSNVGEGIDENVLSEFFDRLESQDAAAEIYLPVELEDNLEVAGMRVSSLQHLMEVLEELKDELDSEDEDLEDEDSYDDDRKILSEQLREAWKLFYSGAQTALERHLPMFVKS
jgi:hypothetical protein